MTFEEWYSREGNHNVVESLSIWSSEEVKKMLKASWTSACETCNIEKDAIINYLKKEVIKKSSYKQVMKRQYRELKQKYDALKEDYELMKHCQNCKHNHYNGCDYHCQGKCDYITKRKWELCK